MNERSVSHTSFVIERQFSVTPENVFQAWADPEARRRWSNCHPDALDSEDRLDFRPGGRETQRVVLPDGTVTIVARLFFDIVANHRILFAYDIAVSGRRLSASLVTVTFEAFRKGTRMVYTEQLALLDGFEQMEERIHGTREGLDRIEKEFLAGG
jgi:uncharacterized protein YndB with AHSA1/START domain